MHGWLHPEGTEGARTYWVRRLAVVVCAVAVIALVVSLATLNGRDRRGAGQPVAHPSTRPPQGVVSAGQQGTVARDAPPNGQIVNGAQGQGGEGAAEGDQGQAAHAGGPVSTVAAGPGAGGADAAGAAGNAKAADAAGKVPAPQAQAAPEGGAACKPEVLITSLTGAQQIHVTGQQELTVTLTNGSNKPCQLIIAPTTFQVTIASGADRIWGTKDCDAWLPSSTTRMEPGKTMSFKIAWPLRRSAGTCDLRPEQLQPGTYVARGQVAGAERASLIMTLRG